MIIVDTNIISYFYLPSPFSESVSELYKTEPVWAAPILWKSEFRNVLTLYLRKEIITLQQALAIQEEAESLLSEHEFEVSSAHVLSLTSQSTCSAYDGEFVALARQINTRLITQDKKLLHEFPAIAVSIEDFLARSTI